MLPRIIPVRNPAAAAAPAALNKENSMKKSMRIRGKGNRPNHAGGPRAPHRLRAVQFHAFGLGDLPPDFFGRRSSPPL